MDSKLIEIERAILADPEDLHLVSRLKSLYEQGGLGTVAECIERLVESFGGRLPLLLKLFKSYEDELDEKLSHVRYFGEDQSHPNQPPHIRELALEFAPLFREQRKALQRSADPAAILGFMIMLPGFRSTSLSDRAVPLISALQDIDDDDSRALCRQPIVVAMNNITEIEANYAAKIFTKFRVDAVIRHRKPLGRPRQAGLIEEA